MQRDPQGHDLVVNATPLGMKEGDPLPLDPQRLTPGTFVGEVVMAQEFTRYCRRRGRRVVPFSAAPTCCLK